MPSLPSRAGTILLGLLLLAVVAVPSANGATAGPVEVTITAGGATQHWLATDNVAVDATPRRVRVQLGSREVALDAGTTAGRLLPGRFDSTAPRASGDPELVVRSTGHTCAPTAATFDVLEVSIRDDGFVNALWATFEHRCADGAVAFGEMRIGLGAPPGLDTTPIVLDLPDVAAGVSGVVSQVRVTSTSSTSVTAVGFVGVDGGAFEVVADGCTGQSLPAGGSCLVSVRATPSSAGPKVARLRIQEASGTRTEATAAQVRAVGGSGAAPAATGPIQADEPRNGFVTLRWPDQDVSHWLVRRRSGPDAATGTLDAFPVAEPVTPRVDVPLLGVETFTVHPVGSDGAVGPASSLTLSPFGPRPASSPPVTSRLAGDNRYDTAVATSRVFFPSNGSADAVVLARGDTFPDALAGAPLARRKNGPLLLALPTAMPKATLDEIDRVLRRGGTVWFLGGPNALSPSLEQLLRDRGFQVRRLAGEDRFETAVRIAEEVDPSASPFVFLATGLTHQDAVIASSAAASTSGIVLLTNGQGQAAATQSHLAGRTPTLLAIGQDASRAHPNAASLAGATPSATSTIVADFLWDEPEFVTVARVDDFADALGGGVLASRLGAPLLLTPTGTLDAAVASWACRVDSRVADVVAFGGPMAVADGVLDGLAARVEGRSC